VSGAPSGKLAGNSSIDEATKLARPPTSEAHERQRWRLIVSQVFDDVPDTSPLFRTLWNHFAQPEHWQLFADVPLVLSTLSERGLVVGIASNFDRRLLKIRDGHTTLRQCKRCFVSSEIGFSKPDPRYFAAVEQQLGLPPEAILLVGDDWENDIVGARAAGWQAVHLRRQRSQIHQSGISSLLELCAIPLDSG
jgi:putative hydrolase of the HAD superfamily